MEQIPIQWYSFVDKIGDRTKIDENTHFKLAHDDTIDINTVLTEIKHVICHTDTSISLKQEDITKTNSLSAKSMLSDKAKARREPIDGEAARMFSDSFVISI